MQLARLVLCLAVAAGGAAAQPTMEAPAALSVPVGVAGVAPGGALPMVRPKGLLTVSGMKVSSTQPEGSLIHFGSSGEWAVGTDAEGDFLIRKAGQQPLLFLDKTNNLRVSAQRVEMAQVDVSGGVVVRGVRQWAMVTAEDFSMTGAGWSRPEVTMCGGVSMLGGFCKFSGGEVNKTFTGLPPHKQLRIVATYHFIDRWIGESGYMKLNIGRDGSPVVVWTEQHAQQESEHGLSLCGQAGTPEGKFAVSVDVTVPHEADSVQVSFGTTMDDSDACDESWGVSALEVHVRS